MQILFLLFLHIHKRDTIQLIWKHIVYIYKKSNYTPTIYFLSAVFPFFSVRITYIFIFI